MAKSNAAKCKDYRKKQPASIKLPMPEETRRALDELMEWHDFKDAREAIATLITRLHELGCEGSRDIFKVKTHTFVPTDEQINELYYLGSRSRVME